MTSSRCAATALFVEQCPRVHAEEVGDLLQGLQRQVSLATLDGAEIGPVDTHPLGERFLAVALLRAMATQVAPHDLLKLAFHDAELRFRAAT
jgi:hypothetical protein